MRVVRRGVVAAILAASAFFFVLALSQTVARAQQQVLLPEQSEAKAKQVLQQAIAALGGDAYLNVQDLTCTGNMTAFDHAGDLSGLENFISYTKPHGKARIEYIGKGRNTILLYLAGIDDLDFAKGGIVITVYNGEQGWSYDRSGVNELPASNVNDYQAQVKRNLDNVLRFRLQEPGMFFRYGGTDIVDLISVDWVNLEDSDNNSIRIAFARATHLPVRKIIETVDPKTQFKSQEIEYYANFHPIQGVEMPFQTARDRNGLKVYQTFYDKCNYNTGVADSLFSRESLEQLKSKDGGKSKESKYSDNGK